MKFNTLYMIFSVYGFYSGCFRYYIRYIIINLIIQNVQVGFRKSRGTRDQIANIPGITEKAREFQKNTYFCFTDYTKAFDCVENKLWKILKEMGLPDHLTCLLRNLYAGQEATVRVLFLPPSDAYVRSFLYLLYTLIKLYYTKALSYQASSLAPDWILLRRPRILASLHGSETAFHLGGSSGFLQDKMGLIIYVSLLLLTPKILSLPFDPQDNAILSWAHSYAAFHNQTAGSVEHSPLHQWKASRGGHLHFKEKTFSKSANTLDNWWHLTTLRWTDVTMDIIWLLILILTCFNDYFALHLELCN